MRSKKVSVLGDDLRVCVFGGSDGAGQQELSGGIFRMVLLLPSRPDYILAIVRRVSLLSLAANLSTHSLFHYSLIYSFPCSQIVSREDRRET